MNYIGIDPGLDGGLAYISLDAVVYSTPTITRTKAKGTKREYNIQAMRELLQRIKNQTSVVTCYLESVHAMPGQGVTSMFSMGQGFGIWQGLLAGLQISFELVTPQRWKGVMLDGTGKDKEASRLTALRMFPILSEDLALKKDEGKAEALLIAAYGKRING